MIRTGLKIAKLGSHLLLLKTSLQNPLLLRQLEIVINKQLHHQPPTHAFLEALQGKVVNITIKGIGIERLGIEWHLLVMHQQILINQGLAPKSAAEITVHIARLPGQLTKRSEAKAIELDGDFATLIQLQGLAKTAQFDLYPGLMKVFGAQTAVILTDIIRSTNQQITQIRQKITSI